MRKQEQSVRTTHDACCRRKCPMKIGIFLTKTSPHTHLTNSTFGPTWKHQMFDRENGRLKMTPTPVQVAGRAPLGVVFLHRGVLYPPLGTRDLIGHPA